MPVPCGHVEDADGGEAVQFADVSYRLYAALLYEGVDADLWESTSRYGSRRKGTNSVQFLELRS